MNKKKCVRWGILSTGRIARSFAKALKTLEEMGEQVELAAVASRASDKADAFATEFGVRRSYGSYEELARDPGIDVIYVASPHSRHCADSILCLENDKHVLCEKPLALNLMEAEQMIATARRKRRFFMEGMWMACFPAIRKIRKLIADGAIGEVRALRADLGFRANYDPENRLFNPALGGGALLDVGVYTVAFAQLMIGAEPETVRATATLCETGVDETTGMVLGYPNGAVSLLSCSVRTTIPHEATICGTGGLIRVPSMFWQPDRFTLHRGGKEEPFAFERIGNGLCFEALEAVRCLRNEEASSPLMPLEESCGVLRTLDRIRAAYGSSGKTSEVKRTRRAK